MRRLILAAIWCAVAAAASAQTPGQTLDAELSAIRAAVQALTARVTELEAPKPPDNPPPPPPPTPPPPPVTPTDGLIRGVNLAGLSYWSTERPFRNLMQSGSEWRATGGGWPNYTGQLTADGYPVGATGPLQTLLLWDQPPAARPVGRYRLTWNGTGTATPKYLAQNIAGGVGFVEFDLPAGGPTGGLSIEVTGSVSGPTLTRAEGGSGIWDQRFLETLRPFKVLRFMDWSATNDSLRPAWSERRPANYRTQAGPYGPKSQGVAWELVIDLCNTLRADPWVCLPYGADTPATVDYCRQLGRLFADRLDLSRTVYLEYGNELWNGQFAAARDVVSRAGGYNDRWLPTWADDCRIAFAAFNDRFQRSRTVRVLATQQANPWISGELAKAIPATEWDALSPACYFNYGNYASAEAIIADCQRNMADYVVPRLADHAAVAKQYGKRLCIYEAGPHHIAQLPGDLAQVIAAHRDPRMGDLMRQVADAVDAVSDGPLCWYYDVGKPHQSGLWGLLEYQDQTASAKYEGAIK